MRDHSNHKSATRHEAVGALLAAWQYDREVESVAVAQAAGRVCAHDVCAATTLPSARISDMDAVAVRFDDVAAGMPDTSAWKRGRDWQFCNTGVAMPEGFDTAIRIESVRVSDDGETVELLDLPQARYECTSERGCVLQPGDVLARAGEVLTPVLLAVLSMGGHTQVDVVKRPRVTFIPTGNELVDAAPEIPAGKNIESNGAMVCAKVDSWGGSARRVPIVPDDPKAILAALREAVAASDVVVINAGSSKGSDDYTCEILEREGEVLFHEVRQGPGRHCSFSLLEGKPVIGISGPPVGAEFTADFFVKPFVDAYLGASLAWPPSVQATMLDDNPMRPRGVSVVRRVAVRRDESERFVAWGVELDSRPALRCCDEANGLVVVEEDSWGWRAGDTVRVELRHPYTLPPYLDE